MPEQGLERAWERPEVAAPPADRVQRRLDQARGAVAAQQLGVHQGHRQDQAPADHDHQAAPPEAVQTGAEAVDERPGPARTTPPGWCTRTGPGSPPARSRSPRRHRSRRRPGRSAPRARRPRTGRPARWPSPPARRRPTAVITAAPERSTSWSSVTASDAEDQRQQAEHHAADRRSGGQDPGEGGADDDRAHTVEVGRADPERRERRARPARQHDRDHVAPATRTRRLAGPAVQPARCGPPVEAVGGRRDGRERDGTRG